MNDNFPAYNIDLGRGQTIVAMESSEVNAGMTARPVIQVRSSMAAVALARP
jgi:hypothetical protein